MLEGCTPWPREFASRYVASGCWEARTLASVLEDMARADPQRVFLADKSGALTHRDLDQLADRFARELLRSGLRPRDIVLLQLPNVRELAIVFFALHKIGVVPVMCLPAHRFSEISHFAKLTGAKAHFFAPGFRGFDTLAMAREVQVAAPSVGHLFATGQGSDSGVTFLGPWLEKAFDDAPSVSSQCRADPFDVAFMLLSGGTTGIPKLIPRTHADYLHNARSCARVLGWGADTVYLVNLPAAHNFALGAPGMVAALVAGASVVMCPSTDPDEIFAAIQSHRATVMPATPALLINLLSSSRRGQYELGSLRQIIVGGQRMLPELVDRLCAAFPQATPLHAFGMAEGLTNLSRPEDPLETKRETQGRPVSTADEIRIVDDEGADVPEGALGELITRGPYTIRGYYRAAEHNASAFTPEGYYRTGDLVRRHPSGNLIVESRKKDVINRGGEKVSAEEVENLLLAHPKIRQVAVVAMPDPIMGEKSCAFVLTRDGVRLELRELTDFLMEKKIAKFKWPERLEVVEAFPHTAMGKVSKKALREQIAARLREERRDLAGA